MSDYRLQLVCLWWLIHANSEIHKRLKKCNFRRDKTTFAMNKLFHNGKNHIIEYHGYGGIERGRLFSHMAIQQGAEYHIVRCLEDFKELINKIIQP